MRVDIYSDMVCPFCYIGKKRFEQALENFSGQSDVSGVSIEVSNWIRTVRKKQI